MTTPPVKALEGQASCADGFELIDLQFVATRKTSEGMTRMFSKPAFCLLVVLALVAPLTSQATILTDNYVAPVVARGNGAGGTVWKTEICLTNPWDYRLIVTDGFAQGGAIIGALRWQLNPGATVCSQDAVLDWLGRPSWSGAYAVAAFASDNPGRDTRFVVGVKIYNTDPRGTFGQALPIGSYVPEAWSIGRPMSYGVMTGIQNYGTAGVSGFRTNVGLFNPATFSQFIEFYVFDSNGNEKWYTTRTVPAMSQIQIAIPSSVVVRNGVGVGVNNGSQFVWPYASIVDNKSGDGVYRAFSIGYENVYGVVADAPGVTTGPKEATLELLSSAHELEISREPRQGSAVE